MSSLRAFGHGFPLRAFRHPFTLRPSPAARALSHCLSSLRREPPRTRWTAVLSRAASTARQARAPIRNTMRHGESGAVNRYPPELNVFRQGSFVTSIVGMMRLGSVIVFIIGGLIVAPMYTWYYFRPASASSDEREREIKWWTAPAIFICSSILPLVTFLAMAPWVHQIHVRLPTLAQRSHEELMRWASHPPRNTVVSFSIIRFRLSPTVQRANLEDLTRLPFKYTRLTNLQHKPVDHEDYLAKHKYSWGARFNEGMAMRVFGRFFVNNRQVTDKSAVPGVWKKIWEQIPMEGEREQRRLAARKQKRLEARAPTAQVVPTSRPKS